MTQKLKTYFPDIRQREELLEQIHGNAALEQIFTGWNPEQQNLFLDCCTGVRGVRMLYDSFFKIIMDPDTVPEQAGIRHRPGNGPASEIYQVGRCLPPL